MSSCCGGLIHVMNRNISSKLFVCKQLIKITLFRKEIVKIDKKRT